MEVSILPTNSPKVGIGILPAAEDRNCAPLETQRPMLQPKATGGGNVSELPAKRAAVAVAGLDCRPCLGLLVIGAVLLLI